MPTPGRPRHTIQGKAIGSKGAARSRDVGTADEQTRMAWFINPAKTRTGQFAQGKRQVAQRLGIISLMDWLGSTRLGRS